MKIAIPIYLALSSGVSAEPCLLKEVCTAETVCANESLSLEFSGQPPQKVETNFGIFAVEHVSEAGQVLDKIDVSGAEWTIKSPQKMLTARTEDEHASQTLFLTTNDENRFSATLWTQPRKYIDYVNARRVFTGPCEKVF
ncbi:hypothetical protein [Leisingera aquaemixtae]|uniref:hypothetical protein n=1 Tax=Leisingera aquaemixtae TaxID=1396826 RepID=UPI0011AE3DF5|nr:hypothetical protein [Leisingera aquaemixtae]